LIASSPHRLIASSPHRKTVTLNVPILKHALGMVQTDFTVCSEHSTAFQSVRSTIAGGKPALPTVTLKPGT
ncbi:MAG: hypothetical protein WCF99_05685, partial [Chloroflexales bacterium]